MKVCFRIIQNQLTRVDDSLMIKQKLRADKKLKNTLYYNALYGVSSNKEAHTFNQSVVGSIPTAPTRETLEF